MGLPCSPTRITEAHAGGTRGADLGAIGCRRGRYYASVFWILVLCRSPPEAITACCARTVVRDGYIGGWLAAGDAQMRVFCVRGLPPPPHKGVPLV